MFGSQLPDQDGRSRFDKEFFGEGVDAGGFPDVGPGGSGAAVDSAIPALTGLAGFIQKLTIAVEDPEVAESREAYDQRAEDIIVAVAVGGKGVGDIDIGTGIIDDVDGVLQRAAKGVLHEEGVRDRLVIIDNGVGGIGVAEALRRRPAEQAVIVVVAVVCLQPEGSAGG